MTGHARADDKAQAKTAEFEAHFFQYYSRVYSVLFRLLGDPTEAEDLTIETFWKLWRQPPKLWQQPPPETDGNALGGWLYRVATRLAYNALRASRRRMQYENAAAAAWQGSGPPDPEQEVERADDRDRVRAVFRRMRDRDAQLLVLRYSGLSYKEIAATTGIAPASVGTLLMRAELEFERLFVEGGSDAPQG